MYRVSLSKADLPISTDGWINLNVGPEVFAVLTNHEPFDRDTARGPDKVIQAEFNADGAGNSILRLGPADDISMDIRTSSKGVLDIVWPDEDLSPIAAFGQSLNPDELYLLLTLDAEAHLGSKAQGKLPNYSLSGSLGLQMGANVHYVHMKRFRSNREGNEIVREFFSGLRLPQNIRTPDDLPAPGEVIAFQYGGYLSIGLDTAWGYTIQHFDELDFGSLDLKSKLTFTSALEAKVSCGVSGDFSLEVRRDTERENWARLVVRKRRQRSHTAALDLNVGITPQTEHLPEDASRFIEAVLGITIPQQVEEFRTLAALDDATHLLEYLEDKADALTARAARDLFDKWYPDQLIEDKAGPFLEEMTSVIQTYDEIQQLDDRLIDTASTFSAEQLEKFLSQLYEMQDRSALATIADPFFWKILRSIAGEDYVDIIRKDASFDERKSAIETELSELLSSGNERLLDLLGLSQKLLNADRLIDELRKYDSAEALKNQAEKHLLELAERLTDRAFAKIENQKTLRQAFDDLRQVLLELDQLKTTVYKQFQSSLQRSYRAHLGRSYARAEENEALLELRVDLSRTDGQRLMHNALHGNLSSAIRRGSAGHAEVISGRFAELSRQTSQLEVNLVGWEYKQFRELAFRTEESLRQEGDRLIHLYRITGRERETIQRRRESMQFTFMTGLLAEGQGARDTRPDLVDVIKQMNVEYGFAIDDRRVTDHEMQTYLALAQYLKLLPESMPIHLYIDQLRTELGMERGDKWGTVNMTYKIAYNPGVLLDLFVTYDPKRDRRLVQWIFRQVAAANFRRSNGSGFTPTSHAEVARGLLSSQVYEAYRGTGLAGQVHTELAQNILETLFNIEEDLLLKSLADVHEAVTADSIRKKDLARAFKNLVKLRNKVERFLTVEEKNRFVNPFFAIIDRLIAAKFSDSGIERDSYAELEIVNGDRELFRVLAG